MKKDIYLTYIDVLLETMKNIREKSVNPKEDYEKMKDFCLQISSSIYNHPMYKFDVYKKDMDLAIRLLETITETAFAGESNE